MIQLFKDFLKPNKTDYNAKWREGNGRIKAGIEIKIREGNERKKRKLEKKNDRKKNKGRMSVNICLKEQIKDLSKQEGKTERKE